MLYLTGNLPEISVGAHLRYVTLQIFDLVSGTMR